MADFFVAADVGNTRIKLGLFAEQDAGELPRPQCTISLACHESELSRIADWPTEQNRQALAWYVAGVNKPMVERLLNWLQEHHPKDTVLCFDYTCVPLTIRLEQPEQVGIDRLMNAVAANRLRPAHCPAVVVDLGTAVTVDLLSAEGVFLGGAILPGMETSAKALHQFTDLLPLVDVKEISVSPPVLGTATVPAIKSGLFWGTLGAIRLLAERLLDVAGSNIIESPIYITGGGAALLPQDALGPHVRYVENLTLSGIALAAMA